MTEKLENCVEYATDGMDRVGHDLHPTDTVKYYREISTHATRQADEQQEKNDKWGVPERAEDQ